jgi:hypothetical protein
MFDKIFGNFAMLAIGIIAFVVLIVGGLYVTIGDQTTTYDTKIQTGTTSLPNP